MREVDFGFCENISNKNEKSASFEFSYEPVVQCVAFVESVVNVVSIFESVVYVITVLFGSSHL